MITASNVKIDSMILHILHEHNFNPLIVLFNDYLKKKYSKKAFLLIRILLKAYVIKNIYKDSIHYAFIKMYISNNISKVLYLYLWY